MRSLAAAIAALAASAARADTCSPIQQTGLMSVAGVAGFVRMDLDSLASATVRITESEVVAASDPSRERGISQVCLDCSVMATGSDGAAAPTRLCSTTVPAGSVGRAQTTAEAASGVFGGAGVCVEDYAVPLPGSIIAECVSLSLEANPDGAASAVNASDCVGVSVRLSGSATTSYGAGAGRAPSGHTASLSGGIVSINQCASTVEGAGNLSVNIAPEFAAGESVDFSVTFNVNDTAGDITTEEDLQQQLLAAIVAALNAALSGGPQDSRRLQAAPPGTITAANIEITGFVINPDGTVTVTFTVSPDPDGPPVDEIVESVDRFGDELPASVDEQPRLPDVLTSVESVEVTGTSTPDVACFAVSSALNACTGQAVMTLRCSISDPIAATAFFFDPAANQTFDEPISVSEGPTGTAITATPVYQATANRTTTVSIVANAVSTGHQGVVTDLSATYKLRLGVGCLLTACGPDYRQKVVAVTVSARSMIAACPSFDAVTRSTHFPSVSVPAGPSDLGRLPSTVGLSFDVVNRFSNARTSGFTITASRAVFTRLADELGRPLSASGEHEVSVALGLAVADHFAFSETPGTASTLTVTVPAVDLDSHPGRYGVRVEVTTSLPIASAANEADGSAAGWEEASGRRSRRTQQTSSGYGAEATVAVDAGTLASAAAGASAQAGVGTPGARTAGVPMEAVWIGSGVVAAGLVVGAALYARSGRRAKVAPAAYDQSIESA